MKRWLLRTALVASLLVTSVACAMAQVDDFQWGRWAREQRERHPLAGSILMAGSASPKGLDDGPGLDLRGLLAAGGVLLLGEIHDNPAHHRVRAALLREATSGLSAKTAAVFEHIATDKQGVLDSVAGLSATRAPGRAADLLRRLDWDNSGWPAAAMFQPLFDAVIDAGLPIVAANLPRERLRAVIRGGAGLLPADERARLRLDAPMPAALLEALAMELKDSHCGALPEQAFAPMSLGQRYRDAVMADALLAAAATGGSALLFAGNGHVRSDRGVPWHVRQREPQRRVLAIMLVEVDDAQTDPAAYVPRDPDGRPAADALIFTIRAERDDPCAAMRAGASKPAASEGPGK